MVVVAVTAMAACSSPEPLSIHSDPEAAAIQVNGQEIGMTPTEYTFSFPDEHTRHTVRASKKGYRDRDLLTSEEQLVRLSGIVRITVEAA